MEGENHTMTMDLLGSCDFGGNRTSKEEGMNGFHNSKGETSAFLNLNKVVKHHNMGTKPSSVQHMMPHRNSCGERFIEQSAENFPDGPILHKNQRELGMNMSSQHIAEFCPPSDVCSNIVRKIGNPTKVDVDVFGGALPLQESSMHLAAPSTKEQSAQLTIFYGGNVNVFNDVSPEQVHKIMFLASAANLKNGLVDISNLAPNTGIINALPRKLQTNLSTAHIKMASFQSRTNQTANVTNFPLPSSPLSGDQFELTKALPQARKASLARFLEKRRERLVSKSPYPLAQENSLYMEERLSSSNENSPQRKMEEKPE